ncbi:MULTISPECIES: hypothetical protein [Pontibacillus]|uniref:Uncharacterized protein n=1 Tax=Pontibacillus chungwhensis TaxID=265426 RepID=A0ABY8V162_9BACI|nr:MULTISPECIES: hypothetical protein [Pontibacillus]MCD5325388.1 hypothetical protein [Pontibacillus sp. HN14]WIF98504.1 hypothetical protein QNI29_02215 [Pontibacillus chungwhensis]
MNPDICFLIENGATVSCFLSDEEGNPVRTDAITCEEVGDREDVLYTLPDGQEVTLQNVFIQKQGFVVVEINGEDGGCLSNPIPFMLFEQLLLCAPQGTEVECEATKFRCRASVVCRNGEFISVKLWIETCQNVQVVAETCLEIEGRVCAPRPLMEPEQTCLPLTKKSSKPMISGTWKSPSQKYPHAIRANKVYDWVIFNQKEERTIPADEVDFTCSPCEVGLFVPATIICSRELSGNVRCGGAPIVGAEVTLSSDSVRVTFDMNPVYTDEHGNFTVVANVEVGVPEDATITATTTIDEVEYSITLPTKISCRSEECVLFVFEPDLLECNGVLEGRVRCGETLIEGAVVTFNSNDTNVTVTPDSDTTGTNGNFLVGLSATPGTSGAATITVTASFDGNVLMQDVLVNYNCPSQTCSLTLDPLPALITCTGNISGNISCGNVGQEGVEITFTAIPSVVTIPPTMSDVNGDFEAPITVLEGIDNTSVLITVNAEGLGVSMSVGTNVICLPPECPCKFRIGIAGNSARATVNVVDNGTPRTLTGDINVSSVQCFIAGPGCNPAVDNFNVTFGGNQGRTINFIGGRRIIISCEDNTVARVFGTARAQGNVFTGIFEVTIELTIGAGNIGTWVVEANDVFGNSFETTFTAPISPITFIGDCDDIP